MSQNTKLIYATAPNSEEAAGIGRALVDARLIACVNIIEGVRSIYRWEEKIEDGKEVVIIMKTTEDKIDAVTEKIKSMHSYDCPAIVALDITGGNDLFLQWVANEVGLKTQGDKE